MKKETRKKCEENVLAYGEVTGHAHRLVENVTVFEGPNNTREFEGSATIRHEEHGPISLPTGEWSSGQVLETDHMSGMQNPVRD